MEEIQYGKQRWNFSDVKSEIAEFLELYEKRPIKNNQGGMTSTHLFWTWYVCRKLNPESIIESGVFKGQGTWLFRQACPNAKIFSIDPCLEVRTYIDTEVRYFTEDFNLIEWNQYLNPQNTLCFFDDHQNAYVRMMQMKWMGFKMAMFEDNYPSKRGNCYSLKNVFARSGFACKEETIIPENDTHASYLKRNIETYTTFPPLFKNEKTRWGDEWNEQNYPTPIPIFKDEEKDRYPVLKEEAGGYTWICYVQLN